MERHLSRSEERIPIIQGKKVNEDLEQTVVERQPRRASLMQSSNVSVDFLNNSITTTAPKGKLYAQLQQSMGSKVQEGKVRNLPAIMAESPDMYPDAGDSAEIVKTGESIRESEGDATKKINKSAPHFPEAEDEYKKEPRVDTQVWSKTHVKLKSRKHDRLGNTTRLLPRQASSVFISNSEVVPWVGHQELGSTTRFSPRQVSECTYGRNEDYNNAFMNVSNVQGKEEHPSLPTSPCANSFDLSLAS